MDCFEFSLGVGSTELSDVANFRGCLVSSGRRAPPKACYFGRFCHTIAQSGFRGDRMSLALSLSRVLVCVGADWRCRDGQAGARVWRRWVGGDKKLFLCAILGCSY